MPWHLFSRPTEEAQDPAMEDWSLPEAEGQLLLDVFRDGDALVIRTPVAGVDPEHLDIAIDGDLLTVRGSREERHDINEDDWFYRECYWGPFSRSMILPVDVKSEAAEATLKNGVLEIRFPIREDRGRVAVRTIEPNVLD